MYKAVPPIMESAETLKAQMRGEEHPLKHQRLHLLYLLASGQAQKRGEAARLLGVGRNAVGRWLDSYQAGGLDELLKVGSAPGRVPILTPEQVEQVRLALASAAGFGSYGEVQQWIAERLGVQIQYKTVYQLVRYRLGATLKVARPSHQKKS